MLHHFTRKMIINVREKEFLALGFVKTVENTYACSEKTTNRYRPTVLLTIGERGLRAEVGYYHNEMIDAEGVQNFEDVKVLLKLFGYS